MSNGPLDHYVPQFYLRKFLAPRSRDGKLWRIDCHDPMRRPDPQPIGRLAARQHFYSIGSLGADGRELDRFLQQYEREAGAPLDRLSKHAQLLPGDMTKILKLVATLSVRLPIAREYMTEAFTKEVEMGRARLDRRDYDASLRWWGADPTDPNPKVPGLLWAAEIAAQFDRECEDLSARQWTTYVVKPSDGFLVTSDSPVMQVGLERDSAVTMIPLCRDVVAVGERARPLQAFAPLCARTNTAALVSAHRYVFAGLPNFPWIGISGAVVEWPTDAESLSDRRRREGIDFDGHFRRHGPRT